MAKGRPVHSAQRAITDLVLGVAKSTEARRRRDEELGFAETDQQFQVAVSGTATELVAFNTVEINFDYPLYYAPGQRDSDLEHPHVSVGAEADADVMLNASVQDWTIDAGSGGYVGAVVRVAVLAAASVAFTGSIHLTFQGFSAIDDEPADVTLEQ